MYGNLERPGPPAITAVVAVVADIKTVGNLGWLPTVTEVAAIVANFKTYGNLEWLPTATVVAAIVADFKTCPRRRLRLHFAAHKPVAAASNPSPRTSPPPPPPLTARKSRRNATSARCARTAATPLPQGAQEPPQRHLRTARNPHRYDTDTNDDGDAAAGTAQRQERR
ncbi:hypothetical protein EDB84DRAFT_1558063 [Lactarius hengduanensis]|nr:hypothetical protein EDB84DRAFT_1558063 [Lactarius hengduanensis]